MALDALAVTKWSSKLLQILHASHVYKLATNQDYEDEIRYAAAVRIFQAPRPTVSTYTRDSTTITYERLTPSELVFIADQRKYFGIRCDSLEKRLAMRGGAMWEEELTEGGWALADAVDTFISAAMSTGTPTANVLNPRTIGAFSPNASAYSLLREMNTVLDRNNVPKSRRHVMVPPDLVGMLLEDEKFVSFNTEMARRTIKGEVVGQVQDLQVHVSTNVPTTGSTYTVQAAWEGAYTYGEVLSEMRFFEKTAGDFDERADSDLVFGGKVTQPQGSSPVPSSSPFKE